MKKSRLLLVIVAVASAAIVLLVKSHMDEARLASVRQSFNELYNDRLLAEKHLHRMSELVHTKKWELVERKENAKDLRLENLSQLKQLFNEFLSTKLSSWESSVSAELEKELAVIAALEDQYKKTGEAPAGLQAGYDKVLRILDLLSDIQVMEAKKLNTDGRARIGFSIAGLQFETSVCLLPLLGIVPLARTFLISSPVLQRHQLN